MIAALRPTGARWWQEEKEKKKKPSIFQVGDWEIRPGLGTHFLGDLGFYAFLPLGLLCFLINTGWKLNLKLFSKIWVLYLFLGAPVTNNHVQGDWKELKCMLSQCGGYGMGSRGWSAVPPPKAPGNDPSVPLPASRGGCPSSSLLGLQLHLSISAPVFSCLLAFCVQSSFLL